MGIKEAGRLNNVSVMTEKKGVLTYEPLEKEAFFGRDGELAYLEKAVGRKKHILVSGIGGIGKTELLRQLIRSVVETDSVDELWMVPWNGSIKDSFLTVIKGERGENTDDRFAGVLSYLRRNQDVRRLILIDNVEAEIVEDATLEILTSLTDSIILSSRLSEVNGFETYTLDSLSNAAGMQVFEYSYGRKLSAEDRLLVESFMERLFMRHTLSIGLVGRYMRRHKVPVSGLGEIGSELHAYTLPQMYKNMYHVFGMNDEERAFLAFLARCPRDSYALSFLMEYYPRKGHTCKSFLNAIGNLADGGWIMLDDDRVSVQPYIAENVIKLTPCPEEVELFVKNVMNRWSGGCPKDEKIYDYIQNIYQKINNESYMLCDIVMCFCEKYLETLSQECFIAYVCAMYLKAKTGLTWAKPALEHMYLKAESVGLYTDILFKMRKKIKSAEQLQELDEYIHSVETNFTVVFRCAVSELFMAVCSSVYSFDLALPYANYVLENAREPELQLTAYTMLLGYYISQENIAEAERVVTELDRISSLGYTHLMVELNKSNLYFLTGRYQEVYRRLSGIEEQALELDGSDRIYYTLQMAIALRGVEQYEKSEEYFNELIDYTDSVLGLSDSVATARYRQEYAILLEKMGRYEEAETQYKMSIAGSDGISADQQVNITRNNLALLYNRMGRGEEAKEILDGLLKFANDKNGIFYMEVLNNHSIACEITGELQLALDETRESFPLLAKMYGDEHRKTIEAKERIRRLTEKIN